MSSSGDGYDEKDPLKHDNVVQLKVPRQKKETKPSTPNNSKINVEKPSEPLVNLPPITKYALGLIVAVHLIVTFLLNNEQAYWVLIHLGFIPGRFTGSALFEPLMFITPITHMLLHGSWLHIAMNGVMLLAFGSGIEKWLGGRNMLVLFFLSGLFGVASHFALNHDSILPVVGASGGLSGLFAAALIMMNNQRGGVQKIWPFIALWIGISILFGFMGSPDGGQIAWAAHVGGFLGGFAVMKLWKKF